MSRPSKPPAPLWTVLTVVVAAYGAGASLAFLGFGAPSVVVLFLPAGVTLSALVLNPRRRWPWILAAVAATEVAVDLQHGIAPRWACGFALANTVEPLVGALLLRRFVPAEVDLLRGRDLTAFLACCVGAGPVAGGAIGATTLALSLGLPWHESFLSFWAGDASGVLTVAGCILAWRLPGRRASATQSTAAVGLAAAATVIGFWPSAVPLFYLPVPVLFLLAFHWPLAVTLTGGLAATVAANLMTSTGHGPWAALDMTGQVRTSTLQLFLATAILGAWLLAVGVAERDRARRDTSVERAARQRLGALQVLTFDLAKAATSEAIAEAIVREGLGLVADHGSTAIVSSDSGAVTVWTTSGRSSEPLGTCAATPHADVVRTGDALILQTRADIEAAYPELAAAWRALDLNSTVCVPIRGDGSRPLGSLTFSFHREHGVDADVVAFADTLANLSGQALRRAQDYEREHDAAQRLQRALLPVLAGGLPGIEVGADYRPADVAHQVGGDWYDVFPLPGGRIGFAVGDVVGHHLAAAAAMARLQSALRVVAQRAADPGQVLDDLDRAAALIADSLMTTVGFADYDPATRLLRYACAGHPPPLLITGPASAYLWEGRSMPLGLGRSGRRPGASVMPDGAALVWYTDGLVERHGEPIAEAMRRLAAEAAALGPQDPGDLSRELLSRMAGAEALGDDTAVLCVRFVDARVRSAQ